VVREPTPGARRLLEPLSPADREHAAQILATCPTIDVGSRAPRFAAALADAAVLLVADGLAVVRASLDCGYRSVITCEAREGDLLLPPSPGEELVGLGAAHLVAIGPDARRKLLLIPALAERIVDGLSATLRQRQEAATTFALTRHSERVRRKLLQLGRLYGHVGRDGIRIDFPVSHALLGEMIGSSRETVTRAVDELQRAGFVERDGSTYWLSGERNHRR
jgi:Crp-like helix-turn-helix domain